MTNFERIHNFSKYDMTMFLRQLENYSGDRLPWDGFPWEYWFNKEYCSNCGNVKQYVEELDRECDCSYCEANKTCRFFDKIPTDKKVIELWLESDCDTKP